MLRFDPAVAAAAAAPIANYYGNSHNMIWRDNTTRKVRHPNAPLSLAEQRRLLCWPLFSFQRRTCLATKINEGQRWMQMWRRWTQKSMAYIHIHFYLYVKRSTEILRRNGVRPAQSVTVRGIRSYFCRLSDSFRQKWCQTYDRSYFYTNFLR